MIRDMVRLPGSAILVFGMALPYVVLAIAAALVVPAIQYSEEFKETVAGILDALPQRRSRSREPFDPDRVPGLISFIAITYTVLLAVFRLDRGAASVAGLVARRTVSGFVVPRASWWKPLLLTVPLAWLAGWWFVARDWMPSAPVGFIGWYEAVRAFALPASAADWATGRLPLLLPVMAAGAIHFGLVGAAMVGRAAGLAVPGSVAAGFLAILLAAPLAVAAADLAMIFVAVPLRAVVAVPGSALLVAEIVLVWALLASTSALALWRQVRRAEVIAAVAAGRAAEADAWKAATADERRDGRTEALRAMRRHRTGAGER